MASATSICSWSSRPPCYGSVDVLPSLCCSTPNSLDDPIDVLSGRGPVNCAVKSRLKSNPGKNVRLAVPAGRSWRGYLCNHQQPKHGSAEKTTDEHHQRNPDYAQRCNLPPLSVEVDTDNILNSSTFKAGMSACICILGVAWLAILPKQHRLDQRYRW